MLPLVYPTNVHMRFIEGLGLGAGTMLAPTYVSENAPRAIRGFLVGFFQLFLVAGSMMAYFINYGALKHLSVRVDVRLCRDSLLVNADQHCAAHGHLDGSSGLSMHLSGSPLCQHDILP